jgi:hypothetical protein
MPAPADVMGAVRAAMRTGSHTEFVQFVRPDGTVGNSRVQVSTHPPRIVVELPGEPASRGRVGEPPRTIDVTTPEAYARQYGGDTSHLDPNSALYRWIMRDIDAFYAARRSGQAHGAGEGRTAARDPAARAHRSRPRPRPPRRAGSAKSWRDAGPTSRHASPRPTKSSPT